MLFNCFEHVNPNWVPQELRASATEGVSPDAGFVLQVLSAWLAAETDCPIDRVLAVPLGLLCRFLSPRPPAASNRQ
jgi:hypothetical protein